MGSSYSKAAGETMNKWINACIANSDSQNLWTENGNTYFFETSKQEHPDGAITGIIWKYLPGGIHIRRSSSFRINGDGTIAHAPKFLIDAT